MRSSDPSYPTPACLGIWLPSRQRADKLAKHLDKNQSEKQIEKGLGFLSDSRDALPAKSLSSHANLATEEANLGIDLSVFAFEKALGIIRGEDVKKSGSTKSILEKYESLWLARARPGGLPESLGLLREAFAQDS